MKLLRSVEDKELKLLVMDVLLIETAGTLLGHSRYKSAV